MRLPGNFLKVIHAEEEKSVVGVAAAAPCGLVGGTACCRELGPQHDSF